MGITHTVYRAATNTGGQPGNIVRFSDAFFPLYTTIPLSATTPGTVYDSNSTGAWPLPPLAPGQSLWLKRLFVEKIWTGIWVHPSFSTFYLVDWLVGVRFDRSITTLQTLNSSSLPRYTDGEGLVVWKRDYTTVSSARVDTTLTYTNSAGTTGKTQTWKNESGLNQVCTLMPLAAGDKGIRQIESIQLGAAMHASDPADLIISKTLRSGTLFGRNSRSRSWDAFDFAPDQGLPGLKICSYADTSYPCLDLWIVSPVNGTQGEQFWAEFEVIDDA